MDAPSDAFLMALCGGAHRSCACGHHDGMPRDWSIPELARIHEVAPHYKPVLTYWHMA